MKKIFCSLIILFVSLNIFSAPRTIYAARHGQRGSRQCQRKFKNVTEDSLMPKGVEQAKCLGEYMEKIGFDGTVFVSPYYRTLETAQFALENMHEVPVFIEPRFQETTGVKDASGVVRTTKECLTKREIKKNFPKFKIPKDMKFPWRLENEKQELLDARTHDFVDWLLSETSGDIFLVGHGGVMDSLVRDIRKRGYDLPKTKIFNCTLLCITYDDESGSVINFSDETFNYLNEDLITDNLGFVLLP